MATRLWNPKQDLPGCVAWWDASQGFVSSSSGGQWTDVVGGLVAATTTASKVPTYSATARNGKPGLTSTGSQSLTFDATSLMTANATVMVQGYCAEGNNGNWRRAFAIGANSDQDAGSIQVIRMGTGNQVAERTLGGNALNWYQVDHTVIAVKNGTSGVVYADAVSQKTGTFSAKLAGNFGRIFSGLGYDDGWVGVLQQIVVTSTAVSASDQAKLEGWCSWYTGQAGANLPAGHAYKNAAPIIDDGSGGGTTPTVVRRRSVRVLN